MQDMDDETTDVFSHEPSSNRGVMKQVQFDARNPMAIVQADSDDEGAGEGDSGQNDNEEKQLLEEDIEGSRPKAKRSNVKLDYNSDSSDDGQEWREKELEKAQAKKDRDSDDDMFSDDEEEEKKKAQAKKQANGLNMLDMRRFERESGLEIDDATAAPTKDNDDDSDEEVTEQNVDIGYFVNPEDGDSQTVSKRTKTHEPKLEAFHLRTDIEEGNFDADGNFMRNAADASAHQDQWLDGLSKSQIQKARLAHEQRVAEEEEERESNSAASLFVPDLFVKLAENLEIGETALEALQRLNSQKKKTKRPGNSFRKKNKTATAEESPEDAIKEAKRKKAIEEISQYADLLLQKSVSSVYDLTREEILREYQKLTGETYTLKRKRSSSPEPVKVDLAEDSQPNGGEIRYEFKWEGSDELHGPYDGATMKAWSEHEYFDERVKVRQVGTEEFITYDLVDYK